MIGQTREETRALTVAAMLSAVRAPMAGAGMIIIISREKRKLP